MFNYPHISVEQYFAAKARRSKSIQCAFDSYNMTPGQVEDWLNNYTTLMNVWFCENLYYPAQTKNNKWRKIFQEKLQNESRLSVDDILLTFNIKTIQNNGGVLIGVEELQKHLMKYAINYKYTNHADFEKDTLTGQRGNLTISIFNEIRKNNKSEIYKAFEEQYPFSLDHLTNPNHPISHIDLSHMEYDRESKIIDYLMDFNWNVARPIFIQHGYIEEE